VLRRFQNFRPTFEFLEVKNLAAIVDEIPQTLTHFVSYCLNQEMNENKLLPLPPNLTHLCIPYNITSFFVNNPNATFPRNIVNLLIFHKNIETNISVASNKLAINVDHSESSLKFLASPNNTLQH